MPYQTADRMVTKNEDGLKVDWEGNRVWLNPPYGREIIPFLQRMNNGIALLPSRTDTRWFHELVIPKAFSIMFMKGRVSFINKFGNIVGTPAFASMLVAYTRNDDEWLYKSKIEGVIMNVDRVAKAVKESEAKNG